jgi:hypothetical protein
MKLNLLNKLPQAALMAAALLINGSVCADTILTFDALPPGQFHNNPIIQSFGDNAGASSAGIVVTGIGTPDISLTWSATNNPNNISGVATRWDYYVYPGEPWAAGQLNQSKVGDFHDLLFTPANSAKAVVKSFNFHGYYGVLNLGGTNYQERFTYNWDILDGGSLSSLASGNFSFLSNSNKDHAVNINYTGAANQLLVLRLTRVASTLATNGDPIEVEGDPADIAVDDITFSEEVGASTPSFATVSPIDGLTNVAPLFAYSATLVDGFAQQVDTNTIRLTLDGLLLPANITKSGLSTLVNFNAGGLLRSGSTHTYELSFKDNAGSPASYTNKTTIVVQRYTSYEWGFTQGDLSTQLGNGVMSYADSDTPNQTTFGITDGSTVPHINGTPARYMHVPAFASDTEGYQLYLNDTGPNVETNAYVNRYTVLYDILVTSPLNWLPFFNTDPYNLNDADFYLAYDGSIGIGDGYSAVGVISPNTWYRIAFVADLAANTLTYYVNGTNVGSKSADGLGGRWSLYSVQDSYPQFLLFNEGDSSGTYTHELYVSSVAVADRVLNSAELAALGGPNANGILRRSFAPKPALGIQAAGNNAVVNWPANYVGYALEQTTSLTLPHWKPVAGITNNSVTLNPGPTPTFFRLVQ